MFLNIGYYNLKYYFYIQYYLFDIRYSKIHFPILNIFYNKSKTMQTKIFLIIAFLCFGMNSQAQLLKKVKEKAREVNQKIDDKIDETVEGILKPDSGNDTETTPKPSNSQSQSTGNFSIIHTNGYPNVSINEFGTVTVTEYPDSTVISGNWWTHGVDIDDRFRLVIYEKAANYGQGFDKGNYSIALNKASLFLAYDIENGQGASKKYQRFWMKSGAVTLNRFEEDRFHFSFSGVGRIGTIESNSNGDVIADKSDVLINGGLSVQGFVKRKGNTSEDETNDDDGSLSADIPDMGKVEKGEIRPFYQFDGEIVHDVIAEKGENMSYTYIFSNTQPYCGMKVRVDEEDSQGDAVMVMDGENVINFVDAMGYKMAVAVKTNNFTATQSAEDFDPSQITKTGKSKTIMGYTCYEYYGKDGKNEMRAWVAEGLAVPWMTVSTDVELPFKGYPLEYTASDGKTTTTITTKEINLNKSFKLNASEYKKRF